MACVKRTALVSLGGAARVDVEMHGCTDPAALDHNPVEAEHYHTSQHTLPVARQHTPGKRHQIAFRVASGHALSRFHSQIHAQGLFGRW
jgi:hypothetical protein